MNKNMVIETHWKDGVKNNLMRNKKKCKIKGYKHSLKSEIMRLS